MADNAESAEVSAQWLEDKLNSLDKQMLTLMEKLEKLSESSRQNPNPSPSQLETMEQLKQRLEEMEKKYQETLSKLEMLQLAQSNLPTPIPQPSNSPSRNAEEDNPAPKTSQEKRRLVRL